MAVAAVDSPKAALSVPFLIVPVAGVASSRGYAIRMESRVLVEGNGESAVLGTVDVAAVTTMMSPRKEVEGPTTFWRVATGGSLISLPMLSRRLSGNFSKILGSKAIILHHQIQWSSPVVIGLGVRSSVVKTIERTM